jgi:hypothetical protein
MAKLIQAVRSAGGCRPQTPSNSHRLQATSSVNTKKVSELPAGCHTGDALYLGSAWVFLALRLFHGSSIAMPLRFLAHLISSLVQ